MSEIQKLSIESKTHNQGASPAGKLMANEFNNLVSKVNEIVDSVNKKVYLTMEAYNQLVESEEIEDDVEYNVLEDE